MGNNIHLERKHWLIILTAAAFIDPLALAGKLLPVGVDWCWSFRPATLILLAQVP